MLFPVVAHVRISLGRTLNCLDEDKLSCTFRAGGPPRVAFGAIGAVAMSRNSVERAEQDGLTALSLMQEALRLLDQWGGALEAGADLDSAICRLRDRLEPIEAARMTPTESETADVDPVHIPRAQNG